MQLMEQRDLAMCTLRRITGDMTLMPQCVNTEWLESIVTRLNSEQSLKAGRMAPSIAVSFLNEHNRQMQILKDKAEVVMRCNAIYNPQPCKASLNMKRMLELEKAEKEANELVERLENVRDSYGMTIKSRVQKDLEQKRSTI